MVLRKHTAPWNRWGLFFLNIERKFLMSDIDILKAWDNLEQLAKTANLDLIRHEDGFLLRQPIDKKPIFKTDGKSIDMIGSFLIAYTVGFNEAIRINAKEKIRG